jgi:hypothetical protein
MESLGQESLGQESLGREWFVTGQSSPVADDAGVVTRP